MIQPHSRFPLDQGHRGWFYVSAAVYGAAGSRGGRVSLWCVKSESSVDTPRMGGAALEHGSFSALVFSELVNMAPVCAKRPGAGSYGG